jgi:hypothetical protein
MQQIQGVPVVFSLPEQVFAVASAIIEMIIMARQAGDWVVRHWYELG